MNLIEPGFQVNRYLIIGIRVKNHKSYANLCYIASLWDFRQPGLLYFYQYLIPDGIVP